MQNKATPIAWPNIDSNPVNEFRTSGYIARAFSMQYPTGNADLRAKRVRDVKPAEYFQHMLKYKDGSAADLHWPELHKLMLHGEDQLRVPEQDSAKRRHVLIPKWNLEDWWYCFEWQHHDSAHIHDIGIRKDAPIIDWEKMKEDNEMMAKVVQYLDSLVTTINPEMDAPVPDQHPCRKCDNELNDDLQDYVELINKLQCHTRCNASYCLHNNHAGEQSCRFGYPKEIVEHTFIQDDDHGHPELVTARNDSYINPHDRLQLQGWHANVDLKPVLSTYATLQYISKYASKSEPRSEAFSDILNCILSNSNPNDSSLASFQKLLLRTVAEHDISAQETCHLLLSIPLYHSSRQFVSLNLNKDAPQLLRGAGNDIEFSRIEEVGRTMQSLLQKYWNRPNELEDITLYQLYLKYKFLNSSWKPCKRENIVCIWP
ncbi:2837_t:CDS:2 [Cetraspora pellucida]|uniref:2837_t:CDS:1 n=1 Tax=Cetraspora pellucida TaxID=1433469 RepID=A0A9N9IE55_9GLOM|nr:2837_t:CDS:2 [Cetraspora pellucida]